MLSFEIEKAIKMHADSARLPIHLVRAVVMVESAGNQWAWNPEPHYRYLVDATTGQPFRALTPAERASETPPDDFPSCPGLPDDRDAEWWGQQASWGLMQVMGAVAREYGYKDWHPRLCDIHAGLQYGCAHLSALRDRHYARHGWAGVLAAYNTGQPHHSVGAGQAYVLKVAGRGGLDLV